MNIFVHGVKLFYLVILDSLNSFKKKEQINSTINQPISPNLITN
jgi:hypothetical protein